MHITLVEKIKADGQPCRKCREVHERLETMGSLARIDRIVLADERDAGSEGMQLAARHNLDVAPFFLVEDGPELRVYTSFLRFQQEVLKRQTSAQEEIAEIMDRNPDLDFI
ncbi:MAG: hypothetical protein ACREWG_03515 [Gammaproteobacteria bacterium]